jgi:NADH pyrophosphatase NudC (nudix superfamily)
MGECAESAVHREILEEVGIRLSEPRFLCSQPNEYLFDGVTYPVLDLFFTAQPLETEGPCNPEEVHAVEWHSAKTLQREALAFQSMRAAWQVWLEANAKTSKPPGDGVHPLSPSSSDRLNG